MPLMKLERLFAFAANFIRLLVLGLVAVTIVSSCGWRESC